LLHPTRERRQAGARLLAAASPRECAPDQAPAPGRRERVKGWQGGADLEAVRVASVDSRLDRVPEEPAGGAEAVREELGDAAVLRRRAPERLAKERDLLARGQKARSQGSSGTARQRIHRSVPLQEAQRGSGAGGAGRNPQRGAQLGEFSRSIEDPERGALHEVTAMRFGAELSPRPFFGLDEKRLEPVLAQSQCRAQPGGPG